MAMPVCCRLLLYAGITLAVCTAASGGTADHHGELVLAVPPPVLDGRAYVPARQFCEWLGARIQWNVKARSVTVGWKGRQSSWAVESPSLLLRDHTALIAIRAFAEAFGGTVTYRSDEARRIVDFWGPEGSPYAAIPIGWSHPGEPPGLSPAESELWRFLVPPQPRIRPEPGYIWEPCQIRVVERWACAKVHPLNYITDDATVVLEKRDNRWHVLAGPGTDIGSQGAVGDIPVDVWRRLRLPLPSLADRPRTRPDD